MVDNKVLRKQVDETVQWLLKSFEVTGFNGSSHSYSYWLNGGDGWAKAYPETTGYLLETLLDYHRFYPRPERKMLDLIEQQAHWLVKIALPSGAYSSGRYPKQKTRPSIFNTGQILFGLITGYELTRDETFLKQIDRSVQWLLEQREPNGAWLRWAWKEDYSPVYYTRVIWPMIKASKWIAKEKEVLEDLNTTIGYYAAQQNDNGSFKNCGFSRGAAAFTHTIAYTLRGLLELYLIIGDDRLLQQVIRNCGKLTELYYENNRLAGSYDEQWNGDYSFVCVTGHLQLGIVFRMLYEIKKNQTYLRMSEHLLEDVLPNISRKKHRGGIPGSIPFWGKYNPLRYPNWAAKFFVELGVKRLEEKNLG